MKYINCKNIQKSLYYYRGRLALDVHFFNEFIEKMSKYYCWQDEHHRFYVQHHETLSRAVGFTEIQFQHLCKYAQKVSFVYMG